MKTASLPIEFLSGWKVSRAKKRNYATVVEIDWRDSNVSVYVLDRTTLNAVPSRVWNGHCAQFVVSADQKKADIVSAIQRYAGDIKQVCAAYEPTHVGSFAQFGDKDELRHHVVTELSCDLIGE